MRRVPRISIGQAHTSWAGRTGRPGGQTVASRTFTLRRGWYFWSFGVHQAYQGLAAVCLAATESFGMSCIHFGPPWRSS